MTQEQGRLHLVAIDGIPEIESGDALESIVADAMMANGNAPLNNDVIAISQKIVSKAEGRRIKLADVHPSERAFDLARASGKDPALVELILREARDVLRVRTGLIIVEHRLGVVLANAGIDQSNLGKVAEPSVLLLPENPDASAAALRRGLMARFDINIAVVIIDSVGRAWRNGVVGITLGCAGLAPLVDLRGRQDRDARPLGVTQVGMADQIASAASLLMGEAAEGRPVVLLRGLDWQASDEGVGALIRPKEHDLFR